jgi:hypothetical protein
MQDGERLYISYGKKVSAHHFTTFYPCACRVVHMRNCRCFEYLVHMLFLWGHPHNEAIAFERLSVQIAQTHFGGTRARHFLVQC